MSHREAPSLSDPIHISTQKLDSSSHPLSSHHNNYPTHTNPLTGSHGDGLDVDEHGIMWDTDVQVLPSVETEQNGMPEVYNVMAAPTKNSNPKMYYPQSSRKDPISPVLDTPVSQNTEPSSYHSNDLDLMQVARQLERKPLRRSDSNVSSQQEIVEEISRNTEKILSQQREMLSKQLTFLAKQQEFLNKGFADLRLNQGKKRKDPHAAEDAEDEEEEGEDEVDDFTESEEEGSITNVTDNSPSQSEQETAIEAADITSVSSAHSVESVKEDDDDDEVIEEEPIVEYHPQSSLPQSQPSPLLQRPTPTPRNNSLPRNRVAPMETPGLYHSAMETPGLYHSAMEAPGLFHSPSQGTDKRHKRHVPRKYRGRFCAPGYRNTDVKKMVTTTLCEYRYLCMLCESLARPALFCF